MKNIRLKRIGIIGHFCMGGNGTDGQTVKTKEINKYLEEYFKEETLKYDTYKNSRNPIKIIKNTYEIVKNSENIILIVSRRGYKIILPIINFFNKYYRRNVYDFVIGGTRYEIFDKNKFIKKQAKEVNKIYVETKSIKKEYEKRNIKNVEVIPNFKSSQSIDKKEIVQDNKKKNLKICTFARIHPAKGVEDSIEAVKLANKKLNKNIFELDIYGEIDKNYADTFANIEKSLPKYIKYKGCVNSNEATKILKKYDVMLFLTYWNGEGFPGTIIDAFDSALPVIATEWNNNFEVLEDGKTGIKVQIKKTEEVCSKLIKLYKNQNRLLKMKYACLEESKKYTPEQAMEGFIKELENER